MREGDSCSEAGRVVRPDLEGGVWFVVSDFVLYTGWVYKGCVSGSMS